MMSVFLVTSSFVTTLLIPPAAVRARRPGQRPARWPTSRTSTSATPSARRTTPPRSRSSGSPGASAMAGMLNLIPRYLPRYGMSPEWAGAVRPLVLILTGTAFLITWIFDASVDGQGGAYATGVLVLFTSAGVAVTLAARRAGQRKRMYGFAAISLVFVYTTVSNVIERPDGVKIGACFVLAIVTVSIASRIKRVFELRATEIELRRRRARSSSATAHGARSGWSPTRPTRATPTSTSTRSASSGATTTSRSDPDVIFVEVTVVDAERLRGAAARARRGAARPLPGDDGDGSVGAERPGCPGPADPGRLRSDPAHLLRVDRGQPGPAVPAVPAVRQRRGRAGDPRGAAAGGAGHRTAARTCTSADARRGGRRSWWTLCPWTTAPVPLASARAVACSAGCSPSSAWRPSPPCSWRSTTAARSIAARGDALPQPRRGGRTGRRALAGAARRRGRRAAPQLLLHPAPAHPQRLLGQRPPHPGRLRRHGRLRRLRRRRRRASPRAGPGRGAGGGHAGDAQPAGPGR